MDTAPCIDYLHSLPYESMTAINEEPLKHLTLASAEVLASINKDHINQLNFKTIAQAKRKAIAVGKHLHQHSIASNVHPFNNTKEEKCTMIVSGPFKATPANSNESIAFTRTSIPNDTSNLIIGSFKNRDSTWRAIFNDRLENFMYPSLRLEPLYTSNSNPIAQMIPPTADQVDAAATKCSKIEWQLEPHYQVMTRSGPNDSHTRQKHEEKLRYQLDQQLEVAERILSVVDSSNCISSTKHAKVFLSHGQTNTEQENNVAEEILSTPLPKSSTNILNGCEQNILSSPRLQRDALFGNFLLASDSNLGVYESEKHFGPDEGNKKCTTKDQLFTNWKKIQNSRNHTDPSEDENNYNVSLYYNECINHHLLPEPLFSRIHDKSSECSDTGSSLSSQLGEGSLTREKSIRLPSLVKNERAECMDVRSTNIGQKHVKRLELDLRHFGLGDEKMNALSKSLCTFDKISELHLTNNRLTDASIIPLLECLGDMTHGTGSPHPRISKQGSSTYSLDKPIQQKKNTMLTALILSQNHIGRVGIEGIAKLLTCCTAIRLLDLSHSKISDEEWLSHLTEAMTSHPSLRNVNLSNNKIGEKGGTLLGDMLTQPCCGITELNISWNNICRSGAMAIGIALSTNTSLITLNMEMNRCDNTGGEQIAASFEVNKTLTNLNLKSNAIGARSAVTFGFFVQKNASLKWLNLEDNNLGECGTKALLHALARGSTCEISLSVQDIDEKDTKMETFDKFYPSDSSPYTLHIGESPYEYAVASELLDSAIIYRRCILYDVSFCAKSPGGGTTESSFVNLTVNHETGDIFDMNKRTWRLEEHRNGILRVKAHFTPPLITLSPFSIEDAAPRLNLVIRRGVSTHAALVLLDLAVNDLFLTTAQASAFIKTLMSKNEKFTSSISLDPVEIVGRLWLCLTDGENVYSFLQTHLNLQQRQRLVDIFGVSTIQFNKDNPTGHWILDLSIARQRKLAVWFAILNELHVDENDLLAQALPPSRRRVDCSQYKKHGKSYYWRNTRLNRKVIDLTYEFFHHLPSSGILEFDYVCTRRHEDILPEIPGISDSDLDALMHSTGAEMNSIYVPMHKRKNIKYQLIFFHLAITNHYLTCEQAIRMLHYFPKAYENCRFKVMLAVHRYLIDLENFDNLLERLEKKDCKQVYQTLGYLNVVNPLNIDLDFHLQFERNDETILLRALVDLSMANPTDVLKIDSEKSDVTFIYSLYQTNSVPSHGKIVFRYISGANARDRDKLDQVKSRLTILKYFLMGERIRRLLHDN